MRLTREELALWFIDFCINGVYFNNDFKTIILILKMIYGISSCMTILVKVLLSALKISSPKFCLLFPMAVLLTAYSTEPEDSGEVVNLWEERVDVCTWGIRLLTHLSIRSLLHSLLFYILKFHLEFEVCCFKKQLESITPRPWIHSPVSQLTDPKLFPEDRLDPASVTSVSPSFGMAFHLLSPSL